MSLVMASIFHFSIDFGVSLTASLGLMPSTDDYWLIAPGLFVIYAVSVAIATGPKRLSRGMSLSPTA